MSASPVASGREIGNEQEKGSALTLSLSAQFNSQGKESYVFTLVLKTDCCLPCPKDKKKSEKHPSHPVNKLLSK